MKIRYLGTAAAEGYPALFCRCPNCEEARKRGGRNIRTRSQALIDDELIIDFPSDSYYHAVLNGFHFTDIHNYIFTHIHMDHCYPKDFLNLKEGYAHLAEGEANYNIYGSEDLIEMFAEAKDTCGDRLVINTLEPYKTYEIGNHKVTPMRAKHGTPHPYIYIIERDSKKLLYAHDTGTFTDETWAYLEKKKPVFDFVSMDGTEGNKPELPYDHHMCIPRNVKVCEKLRELGLINDNTILCVNHFSHNGTDSLYEEMCEIGKAHGFIISYDGMEVEF